MTRRQKIVSEFFVTFGRFSRGEISREQFDEAREKLHVAMNGPEPGRLAFDGTVDDAYALMSEKPVSRVPTTQALDCLAECFAMQGRAYLVMSVPHGDLNGTVSVRFGKLNGEEAVAMIAAFIEGQPDVKEALLDIYGEQAMDLRVKTEAIRAQRSQDFDREIEEQEAARGKAG